MEIQLTSTTAATGAAAVTARDMTRQTGLARSVILVRALIALCKPRIGLAIALSAVAGAVVAGNGRLGIGPLLVLALAVLLASFGAAGFNHYLERDLDRRMRRTRQRPFASGLLQASPLWTLLFSALIAIGSGIALAAFGVPAALFVLAGALTYVLVYTVWLKPASDFNIVIGGAAGSWAVLAGAAAGGALGEPAVIWLALVLFLWTPSHFWPLSIALTEDYRAAGLPMLPVTRGPRVAARWIMINALLLLLATGGLGWALGSPLFWLLALTGAGWLLVTCLDLLRDPVAARAMTAFFASLVQLGLLLTGIFLNAAVG